MKVKLIVQVVGENLYHLMTEEKKISLGLYTDVESYKNVDISSHLHLKFDNGELKTLWYVGDDNKVIRISHYVNINNICLS